jgi:putative transposase
MKRRLPSKNRLKRYLRRYQFRELKDDIKDYMKFYNHRRFHETLEYRKPMAAYFNSLKVNNDDYENSVERE